VLNVCRSDKKIDAKKHENAVLSPTKRSAISYKTQCYLLQNAVLTPAKRNAISCKTQLNLL